MTVEVRWRGPDLDPERDPPLEPPLEPPREPPRGPARGWKLGGRPPGPTSSSPPPGAPSRVPAPAVSARCFECASCASWRSALVSSWLVSQLESSSAPPPFGSVLLALTLALGLAVTRPGRSSLMLARLGLSAPAPHAALFCLFSLPRVVQFHHASEWH